MMSYSATDLWFDKRNPHMVNIILPTEMGLSDVVYGFEKIDGARITIIDGQIVILITYQDVIYCEAMSVRKDDIKYKILEGQGPLKDTVIPLISLGRLILSTPFCSYFDDCYQEGMDLNDKIMIMMIDTNVNKVAAVRYEKMPIDFKLRLQEVWDKDKRSMMSQKRIVDLYNLTLDRTEYQLWHSVEKEY